MKNIFLETIQIPINDSIKGTITKTNKNIIILFYEIGEKRKIQDNWNYFKQQLSNIFEVTTYGSILAAGRRSSKYPNPSS